MTKLEEAARTLIADYDATNQPDNIWTTLPVQWPQLEALRAALAEHEAEPHGAIARGWCSPENAAKEMDVVLAKAIAEEVARAKMPPTAPLSAK